MKPMLAATVDKVESLRYPLLASPKLDGIRAIVRGGCVLSRNLKPIPNHYVQELFCKLEGYDGELIVGDPRAKDCYRATMSGVMSADGKPAVMFSVFDHFITPEHQYRDRLRRIHDNYVLPHQVIDGPDELLRYEEVKLRAGYEGVMLRDPRAPYKFGRSTLNEGWLMKLKRFLDDEATVVGIQQLYSNQNEAKVNALGHTERSSHKENQVAMPMMGALICQWQGKELYIGGGFTHAERETVWSSQQLYIGRKAKFKYLPIGMKDLPRHPIFLGWREE